jgi:GTPase SAR1 family protein
MIGKEEIETFKVIIVGEYASGKSALHKRLIRDEFDPYSS